MENNLEKSVADSLETNPQFLPYLPDLLTDLWELGCSLEQILKAIKQLNLSSDETEVLDLGSGKGAVSIMLAKQLGFKVVGVDACKPFIEVAIQKAIEHNVQDLCKFIYGDIRLFVREKREFDLVIYASLGGVLGNFAEIIKRTRNCVKTGGYILIDDGYLKGKEKVDRAGYQHYVTHSETIKQLTTKCDKIVLELSTEGITRDINIGYLKAIKKRAATAIQKYPHLKKSIEEYIKDQKIECEVIEKFILGALWVIQRSEE
jgi:ubiquinone/menaquinone biosynthesis C-methylase UbiE